MLGKKTALLLGLVPLLFALYKMGFAFESFAPTSQVIQNLLPSSWGAFPNDPLKFLSDTFGLTALFFLIATLSLSPLYKLFGLRLLKWRRFLGLFTFFYALLHMMIFFIIDLEMSVAAFYSEALEKPFLFFGVFAFFILLLMALTSTKKRFKRYHRWHKLIYLATLFVILHYLLSLKVISLLAGFSSILLLVLLALRLKLLLNMIKSSQKSSKSHDEKTD